MAGSCRLAPNDWGISTKGVRSDGMLPSTEGMAWIERVPLAYMRRKVRLRSMSESRKGVMPRSGRPSHTSGQSRAECSADMLSMMKIMTLRPERSTAAESAGSCTGVKRASSSPGAK